MTLNRLLHSQSDIQISNLPLLETDRDESAKQKMQRTMVASNATHSGRKQYKAQWAQAMQRTVGASNATHSRTGLERLGDKNTLAVRKKNKAFIRYSHVTVKWDRFLHKNNNTLM